MVKVRERGEAVRKFVIANLAEHECDIVKVASEKFGFSRQAVFKHLQKLVAEGVVIEDGRTRGKTYKLAPLVEWQKQYSLPGLSEDRVWRDDVAPQLGKLPENVLNIWHYGVTEMVNNVIDHSGAEALLINIKKTAASTKIDLLDNGVGIFRKIKEAANLDDERHAVLELAKGKFTTDPANHSGEGIFFTSRMFDRFSIYSGTVHFGHEFAHREDWIVKTGSVDGTFVSMSLGNHTARTTKKVFDKFATGEDYGFNKTVVPVQLTEYGDSNLVSRSQAKRLLARFDRFKTVILDFAGVKTVGQAFADEVFRVFPGHHPEVELIETNANAEVSKMISRARAADPA
jgi:biotin operon repressor/anti-sigma regulatory factor (Ser/Thr protein kinase)